VKLGIFQNIFVKLFPAGKSLAYSERGREGQGGVGEGVAAREMVSAGVSWCYPLALLNGGVDGGGLRHADRGVSTRALGRGRQRSRPGRWGGLSQDGSDRA
jgi:hypothetical protein